MDCDVAPLLHWYELLEEAVSSIESPRHMELAELVMEAIATGLRLIFSGLLEALHPETFVTFTVYGKESFT